MNLDHDYEITNTVDRVQSMRDVLTALSLLFKHGITAARADGMTANFTLSLGKYTDNPETTAPVKMLLLSRSGANHEYTIHVELV